MVVHHAPYAAERDHDDRVDHRLWLISGDGLAMVLEGHFARRTPVRDRLLPKPEEAGRTGPGVVRGRALIGIVAISFSAILVVAADVSPGTAAFFRAAYAIPPLLVLWLVVRGRDTRPGAERWLAFAGGLLLGLDLNLWHRSIAYVGAGLATVIANTQVLFVAALAWLVHQERPTPAALVAVPVALAGVLLTAGVGQASAFGNRPGLGALLAMGAAAAYAGYLLLFRAGNRSRCHPAGPLLDATVGTAAASLVLGGAFDASFSLLPEWPAHGWLVLLALGAHALGWLFIATALPRLPALDTSVLLLVQPCLTVLWGVLLFSEAPSWGQWVGIALVLAGVGLASRAGAAARDEDLAGAPAG